MLQVNSSVMYAWHPEKWQLHKSNGMEDEQAWQSGTHTGSR